MKRVALPSGETVPALGQGTWYFGEDPARRQEEIATLQRGIDLGLTLIDTAEMYGEGLSEALVGDAIEGRRDEVFIVSKVYPHNASRGAMHVSCDNSLKRLRVDAIDLYLLHWPGDVPLAGRRHLVVDIGGGSTEFVLAHGRDELDARSLKLGAIRLTERLSLDVGRL